MDGDKTTVGTGAPEDTAARNTVTARDGAGGGGNTLVADKGADVERDPLAYRDAGKNRDKRVLHMERLLIDNFYGGSVQRYDEAAGLDFDA